MKEKVKSMNECLEVKNLNVWYEFNKPIIKNLDLTIYDNEIVGLIGLNGAGKTTLFNTITNVHDKYKCDEIKFNNKQISFNDIDFKYNRFIVFSEDESFQYFTFNEYIKYTFQCYNKKIDEKLVTDLCEKLNFTDYRNVLMRKLSLGNKRKAHLITGLALKCKILILDEPFNGIDFEGTETLYDLLQEYKNYGTVIFSSHILETICMITDRILILEKGKITNSYNSNEFDVNNIRKELSDV